MSQVHKRLEEWHTFLIPYYRVCSGEPTDAPQVNFFKLLNAMPLHILIKEKSLTQAYTVLSVQVN